ncbi:MAG: 2-oxoacid:acceptor oxidoreductase family protein [Candidatus Nezhaarchaeota archaeon]|nr:2-oxoacid:acceptor oxidoreductase family protein [Candidatus Nezhaarchaeota archaeon]MCX8141459.1 2-oxoacid:acceptor oxidoreductase family protein [Candidatus Nezhaarchaeota archaeon]MDW8049725.1 2-oxoacid:acceptor oxidoreductase family protein [Nitrososphaerota archaeon]
MIEVRWHGRGGQGVVTAAELLASAAVIEGKWAQAFPSFGAERRGAPVQAYTRINDKPIFDRSFIYEPDVVVVVDQSLLEADVRGVLQGIKPNGKLIVNTNYSPQVLAKKLKYEGEVATVDATSIAIEVLGRPIVNTAMLGAVIKSIRVVELPSVLKVLEARFKGAIADRNVKALIRAFENTAMEVVKVD